MGILSERELGAIKNMAVYWEEVEKRENRTPLRNEDKMMYNRLGEKLLWIILSYIEMLPLKDENVSLKETLYKINEQLVVGDCPHCNSIRDIMKEHNGRNTK